MRSVAFAGTLAACAALATSATAAEPTKDACISANESGQDLRRAGKLREARELFELCAAASCPAVLRDDCVKRLGETKRAQPTVVFVAKNARNEPVSGIRVSVDGAPPVPLDAAPIALEPGEHHFELVADGYTPAWKTLSMMEGFHAREEIVLSPRGAASKDEATSTGDGSSQRMIAYGVGGAGALGLAAAGIFGLLASGAYDAAKNTCGPNHAACAPGTNDKMSSARTWADLSTGFAIGGAVFLAGGLYLFFTAPQDRSPASAGLDRWLYGRW